MPKYIMLIGVPASGKSTWVRKNAGSNTVIASSDDYIDAQAAAAGKTYSEVFGQHVKAAAQHVEQTVAQAVKLGNDIVHDQTNLTVKSRKSKLVMIPDNYEKIAVVFPTPSDNEWRRRLASRPGKTIPSNILLGMQSSMQLPTADEGFDKIIGANA
jgi:predicted kinase